jgi:two-component system, NtrC family, sensor kinase
MRVVAAIFAVILAAGVFGFLVYGAHSRSLTVESAIPQFEQLHALRQLDESLITEAARSRSIASTENTRLAETAKRLSAAQDKVKSAEMPSAAAASAFLTYKTATEEKKRVAAQLDDKRRQFIDSFQAFRQEAQRAIDTIPPEQSGLRSQLVALLSNLGRFAIQSAPDNATQLDVELGEIERQRPTGAVKTTVERARSILTQKSQILALAKTIMDPQSLKLLDDSRARLLGEYRAVERQARESQVALQIYAGALLLVFGIIGLRLRSSIGALNHANEELRRINVGLEEVVSERTGELRKAMEDLKANEAQLVQSEKMASLGQMVAGVAHEINTPLGYARSNVETVRDIVSSGPMDEQSVQDSTSLLNDALHGLGTIGELVMSLKDFSRVDRSRTELFNVNEGLDTALKIAQNHIKGRIEVEREYGALPDIKCAPSQLNQVFLNILTNAAQAIEGDGKIRVRTRDTGKAVEIAIRDSGCGMDAEVQKHIFEPFFTTKDVGKGTGLGLSIVFKIIEDHKGKIVVNSKPGQGTEFTILLPKEATAPQAISQEVPQLAQARG